MLGCACQPYGLGLTPPAREAYDSDNPFEPSFRERFDKLTLKRIFQPWGGLVLELLGNSYGLFVLPPEAGGPRGELWGDPQKAFIGSGPFVFEKWTPDVKWTLTRNPDYWVKGKPYVDRVEYMVTPEASTQVKPGPSS